MVRMKWQTFTIAGFEAFDMHMQDLLDGNIDLKQFKGMAVCGVFHTEMF